MLRDRQIVEDLIKDERFLNVCETFCAVEASPQLKATLLDIQREEQDMHTRLYQYAQRQGWYPTLWGDMGFHAQPAGMATGAAAGVSPQAQVQPWIAPQPNFQQPAWQQQPWQQQPAYAGAGFQPGGTAPLAASSARFGLPQAQTTGPVQVAGREYGPY